MYKYPTAMGSSLYFRDDYDSAALTADAGGDVQSGVTIANGRASFDGTVNGYIRYPELIISRDFTIRFDILVPSLASIQNIFSQYKNGDAGRCVVLINTNGSLAVELGAAAVSSTAGAIVAGKLHKVVITRLAGQIAFYVDGVAQGGSGLGTIIVRGEPFDVGGIPFTGATGLFSLEKLKVYRMGWTAKRAIDDFKKSTYTELEGRRAAFYLDCKDSAVKDGVRQTTNKGYGGRVLVGDGTTSTTFPTLLSPRGFRTDGADYLASDFIDFTGATGLTMFTVVRLADSILQMSMSFEGTIVPAVAGLIGYNATNKSFDFYSGAASSGQVARSVMWHQGINILIGTASGTSTQIWVNGQKGTDASTPLPPAFNSTQKVTFMSRISLTQMLRNTGVLYSAGVYPTFMTPSQIMFLTQKLKNEFNN